MQSGKGPREELEHIICYAAAISARDLYGRSAFFGATKVSHILSYALNHMVAPRKTFAELVELATALGLDQVEIRNDLPGVAISDGTPPARIREQAEAAGVRILSINALQRFNDWNEERAREAARLAGYARG